MHKFYIFFYIGLLTSIFAFADINDRLDDLERKIEQVLIYTPQNTIGASFNSANPEILTNDEKVYIIFDILYWHPKVGGTVYAYSNQPTIIPNSGLMFPEINGRTKENTFNWDWGLKVGLGYYLPHDNWDLSGEYTWYDTHSTDSSTKAPPNALLPLRLFTHMIALKAKSHFDLGYHNVDVTLANSYFISRDLSFQPFISLKTTWLDLDQHVVYTASRTNDSLFIGPINTTGFDFKSKNRNQYWGIGPRMGVNTKGFLGNGFNLFGDLAGSILYGHFKICYKEFIPHNNIQFPKGNIIKIRDSFHRFIPFVRLYAGLGWQGYVNHDQQYITLKLGYEVQYYWSVNQILHSKNSFRTPPRIEYESFGENVMLYGVTGEFRFDF